MPTLEAKIRAAIHQVADEIRPDHDVLAALLQSASVGTHVSPEPQHYYLTITVPFSDPRHMYRSVNLPGSWQDDTEMGTITGFIRDRVGSNAMIFAEPIGKCQRALFRIEQELRAVGEKLPDAIEIDDQEFRNGQTIGAFVVRSGDWAYAFDAKLLTEESDKRVTDEMRPFIHGVIRSNGPNVS